MYPMKTGFVSLYPISTRIFFPAEALLMIFPMVLLPWSWSQNITTSQLFDIWEAESCTLTDSIISSEAFICLPSTKTRH